MEVPHPLSSCLPSELSHTPTPLPMDEPDPLSSLPGEVITLICLRLDTGSLARLEQCSAVLYTIIQAGSVWRKRAEAGNATDPYPFITGMLDYVRQRQISDSKAFKIILGSRNLLEVTVDIQLLPPSPDDGFKVQAATSLDKILRDKSIQQLKALSRK